MSYQMTVPASFFQHIPLGVEPIRDKRYLYGTVLNWNPPRLPNHYIEAERVPPRDPKYRMTYVWDLDRTLINANTVPGYTEGDDYAPPVIRPYAREVLALLQAPDVEFVIWTAGVYAHAYRVMRDFPTIRFDYVVTRRDNEPEHEHVTRKDLRRLHRDMNSIVLIDDRGEVSDINPGHVLVVPRYEPMQADALDDAVMIYVGNVLTRASHMYRCYHDVGMHSVSLASLLDSPLVRRIRIDVQDYREIDVFSTQEELDKRIEKYNERYLLRT